MAESLQTGLLLLVVGMITVFVVLSIVVMTGKVLIFSMNRVHKEPQTQSPKARTDHDRKLSPGKLAAIAIATQLMTEGAGRIKSVQRIES